MLLLADLVWGSLDIPIQKIVDTLFFQKANEYSDIILQFRLPKALTAMLAGSSLAIAGLLMQTLFKNPWPTHIY